MVTVAEALTVVSAWIVAFTVTVAGLGTAAGAVNSPVELIVPEAEVPPVTPFTLQVTALFVALVTVAANCWSPLTVTCADAGLIVTFSAGPVIVKLAGLETPAPAPGFATVTGMVPPWEISAAGTAAVSCPEFCHVVFSAVAPKLTTAPGTKLFPETPKLKDALPAATLDGDSKAMAGLDADGEKGPEADAITVL